MILATVRNTGTQFTAALLEPHFERHNGLYEPATGNDLWISHTETDKMPRIREKVAASPPLVCTMRHPLRVAEGWIKRGNTLDYVFTSMWHNLFDLMDETPDAYWLPIDHPQRDGYLGRIADRLGIVIQTNWKKKGETGNNHPWRDGMTLKEAAAFLRTLPFDQFGYEL